MRERTILSPNFIQHNDLSCLRGRVTGEIGERDLYIYMYRGGLLNRFFGNLSGVCKVVLRLACVKYRAGILCVEWSLLHVFC